MEKEYRGNAKKLEKNMKNLLIKLLFFSIISSYVLRTDNLKALIPYYYQPSIENLEKESLSIGRSAYQLLYFGQIKDSLNLAKLAVKINKSDEKLWAILAEAQIANNLYKDALISLNNAQRIDPTLGEIYFAKSKLYLNDSKINEARNILEKGIKFMPENYRALFQLGNIYLMDKDYKKAIEEFEKAVQIKIDFWQAINNQGLAYFELDEIDLSINYFEKAITLEESAEPLLALASCLRTQDINTAILLAKKALVKEPKYVEYDYRKEQLWGEKLQQATEKLFQNTQLQKDISLAKTKINKTY